MNHSNKNILTQLSWRVSQGFRKKKVLLALNASIKHLYDKENDSHFVLDTESRSTIMPHSSSDSGLGAGMTKMECGRSMVEMLGTLVIIGVLSVVGVIGYSYAMAKLRANDTINELNTRAVVLLHQVFQGRTVLNNEEFSNTTSFGYMVDANIVDKNSIMIKLSGVPQDVCGAIVTSGITQVIDVNSFKNVHDKSACLENNEMFFFYNTFLNGCITDDDCSCGICENGQCINNCDNDSYCVKDINSGNPICCDEDKIIGGLCCNTVDENGQCCDENHKCCPEDKPILDINGNCTSCSEQRISISSEKMCSRCSEKEVVIGISSINCANKTCPEGYFRNSGGTCTSCNYNDSVAVYKAEDCFVCPNRLAQGALCVLGCQHNAIQQGRYCVCSADTPMMEWNGKCHPCTSSVEMWRQDMCKACSNKVISGRSCVDSCVSPAVAKDGRCVCPEDKPLMDMNGRCHSCDEDAEINVYINPQICGVCNGKDGRRKRKLILNIYPMCVLDE